MNPLHPNVITAWRIVGVSTALISGAAIAAFEFLVLSPRDIALLAPGVTAGAASILGLIAGLLWPALRYRCWGWEVRPDQVIIEHGVLWRTRSLIPRVRIQHVDTRTTPLQRWLGLSSLIIYTAGTHGSDAELPGLAASEAETLREELARLEELDERA